MLHPESVKCILDNVQGFINLTYAWILTKNIMYMILFKLYVAWKFGMLLGHPVLFRSGSGIWSRGDVYVEAINQ